MSPPAALEHLPFDSRFRIHVGLIINENLAYALGEASMAHETITTVGVY